MSRVSIRLATFTFLFAIIATNATARELVPVVACPGGSLGGPFPLVRDKSVAVDMYPATASHLAFYAVNLGARVVGVLAPREWQCRSLMGSGDFVIIVAPNAALLSSATAERNVPRVFYRVDIGGTSGRFPIANYVQTYFPKLDLYVAGTIDEEKHLREGTNPNPDNDNPYPHDVVSYLNDHTLAFMTPSHTIGLGAVSEMSAFPTFGLLSVSLTGNYEPFSRLFTIRLPPNLMFLKSAILNDEQRRLKQMQTP